MENPEERTDRYLPAMGLSSGIHLAALLAVASAAWSAPVGDTLLVSHASADLDTLVVEAPHEDAPRPDRKEPPVNITDPSDPDLTGMDGEKDPKDPSPSLMPEDVKVGEKDQTAGGATEGGIAGEPASLDLDAGMMLIDPNGHSPWKVAPGHSRKGVSNENVNPFGPRRDGPGGPDYKRKPDQAKASAIARALSWLERHQEPTGAWTSSFAHHCRDGRCEGAGDAEYDVGLTSLASLAFLAHGDSPSKGTLGQAVGWIRKQQAPDGRVGPGTSEKLLYNHALATMVLAEAAGTLDFEKAHDEGLSASARKAVDWLVAAQNPGAGWRYRNYNLAGTPAEEGGNNDTSVTGWCVMALKDARTAGFIVPDSAFQGASAWLDAVSTEDPKTYQATCGYTKANAFVHASPLTTTAVGLLCRELMSQTKGVPQAQGLLLSNLPSPKSRNLYYWYYATLAMYQAGGRAWTDWFIPLKKTLLDSQVRSGCAQGSWEPRDDPWGEAGGRVYTTSVGALCLMSMERYYRVQAQ